ncbi:MAG TPA: cytochrome c oxidase subunit 3 [Candidatus Acidoferrales bacterium]|nr:cytochrome c oxidase subunit 3 [Candidatus Acidoferrales bacterium]
MSEAEAAAQTAEPQWVLPYRGTVGMATLIVAESAIFLIFVVAYLFYIGKSISGPTPREVLEMPIFASICLLSSSLTIHYALAALRKAQIGMFTALWFATFALGAIFIVATGLEWRHLIYEKGLTISTNLFGTTYYSLVGLHAFHVCVGLLGLLLGLLFALMGKVQAQHSEKAEVFSLYWHFVDAVWVVVFTVVYIVGR